MKANNKGYIEQNAAPVSREDRNDKALVEQKLAGGYAAAVANAVKAFVCQEACPAQK